MINNISVLVDNDSWILPYAKTLVANLNRAGKNANLYRSAKAVPVGDVCFLLGCTKIVGKNILVRNRFNMVVHESALPKGKGFAPVAWQILEGVDSIPVCLIEAGEKVDSGAIWINDYLELEGHEVSSEWRKRQGEITIKLAEKFVYEHSTLISKEQQGEESFYPRRTPIDSEIDINKKFEDLIPLLRVVDNKNYPAFFNYKGHKYKLEISKYE